MIVLICLLIYETPVSSERVSCLHLFALSPEPRALCPLWRGAGGLEARCPPSSPRIPPGQQTARAGVCPTFTTGELSLTTGGASCRTGCLAEAFPHKVPFLDISACPGHENFFPILVTLSPAAVIHPWAHQKLGPSQQSGLSQCFDTSCLSLAAPQGGLGKASGP